MTNEITNPTSAATLAALFDIVVEAVATRVLEKIPAAVDDNDTESIEGIIEAWADSNIHDHVVDVISNLNFDISVR